MNKIKIVTGISIIVIVLILTTVLLLFHGGKTKIANAKANAKANANANANAKANANRSSRHINTDVVPTHESDWIPITLGGIAPFYYREITFSPSNSGTVILDTGSVFTLSENSYNTKTTNNFHYTGAEANFNWVKTHITVGGKQKEASIGMYNPSSTVSSAFNGSSIMGLSLFNPQKAITAGVPGSEVWSGSPSSLMIQWGITDIAFKFYGQEAFKFGKMPSNSGSPNKMDCLTYDDDILVKLGYGYVVKIYDLTVGGQQSNISYAFFDSGTSPTAVSYNTSASSLVGDSPTNGFLPFEPKNTSISFAAKLSDGSVKTFSSNGDININSDADVIVLGVDFMKNGGYNVSIGMNPISADAISLTIYEN
jgi:hypothetical protein